MVGFLQVIQVSHKKIDIFQRILNKYDSGPYLNSLVEAIPVSQGSHKNFDFFSCFSKLFDGKW